LEGIDVPVNDHTPAPTQVTAVTVTVGWADGQQTRLEITPETAHPAATDGPYFTYHNGLRLHTNPQKCYPPPTADPAHKTWFASFEDGAAWRAADPQRGLCAFCFPAEHQRAELA
jgi:hypothetical protein